VRARDDRRGALFTSGFIGTDPALLATALPDAEARLVGDLAQWLSPEANGNFAPNAHVRRAPTSSVPDAVRAKLADLHRRHDPDPFSLDEETTMKNLPTLLDDAGDASVATAIMMSHHAFRRDIVRFGATLKELAGATIDRLAALRDEWRTFRNTLHGHHHAEDTGLFPNLARQHDSLRETLERLTADHRHIDPLLERRDRAFADLPQTAEAATQIIAELTALLDPHLATEEAEVIPHMRAMKAFPPPGSDEEAAMFAQGFAWASHGVAPNVLNRVYAMLPANVSSCLPAARAAFEQRWRRVWGDAEAGASLTPIPDR
jgi:hemerythrin-like domain-containing protein